MTAELPVRYCLKGMLTAWLALLGSFQSPVFRDRQEGLSASFERFAPNSLI